MKTEYWGMISYGEAWKRQTELFDSLVMAREKGLPYENRLIFCQHPHVYTLGRHGKETNMLLTPEQLERIHAELFHIDRGGDITYHGPGQLVCYPILNLEDFHLGLKSYLDVLEEAVIRVCARMAFWPGVWPVLPVYGWMPEHRRSGKSVRWEYGAAISSRCTDWP